MNIIRLNTRLNYKQHLLPLLKIVGFGILLCFVYFTFTAESEHYQADQYDAYISAMQKELNNTFALTNTDFILSYKPRNKEVTVHIKKKANLSNDIKHEISSILIYSYSKHFPLNDNVLITIKEAGDWLPVFSHEFTW